MQPDAQTVLELNPGAAPDGRRRSKRKTERRALDRYYTPEWATQALLHTYPSIRGIKLLDPCSGSGAMATLVGQRFGHVATNDIDPSVPADTRLDAADPALYTERPCWVVTNPPFTAAGDICFQATRGTLTGSRLAPGGAVHGVAVLLRITFLEPCGSSPTAPRNGRLWLGRTPPTAQLVLPRIDFIGDGKSDSATACWFIWSRTIEPGIRVLAPEALAQTLGQEALRLGGTL